MSNQDHDQPDFRSNNPWSRSGNSPAPPSHGIDPPPQAQENPWERSEAPTDHSSYGSAPPPQLQENPWERSGDQGERSSYGYAPPQQQYQSYAPPQQSSGGYAPPQQQQGGFAPPSGPPPGQLSRRSDTFRETDFIPESERGEQREIMEQYEMNKSGTESQQDRDVAQLQREFPSVDGSLIAALHGDSGSIGATRETLQELASQT